MTAAAVGGDVLNELDALANLPTKQTTHKSLCRQRFYMSRGM